MPKSEDLSLQDLYDRVTLRLRDLYKDNQDLKAALAQAQQDAHDVTLMRQEEIIRREQAEQRVRELEEKLLELTSGAHHLPAPPEKHV
jgi:hypothetical protein